MKHKIIAILLTLIACNGILFSQSLLEMENKLRRNEKIQFAFVKPTAKPTANEKVNLLKEVVDNDGSIEFVKTLTEEFSKGVFFDKYQLYKNGIKLRGGEYLITYDNSKILYVHGFYAPIIYEQSVAKTQKTKFIEKAVTSFFGEKADFNSQLINSTPLIYYFNYQTQKYQLAYEVYLEAKAKFRAENIYISAIDGSLLGLESKICYTNFPGTAQTQYNGVRSITTDAPNSSGPFRLFETRGPNNVVIHTRNNNFAGLEVGGASDLFDNDNNWTFAEHGNLRAGFDAHWGAETTFDYWREVHNRNSINNAGMQINSYFNVDVATPTGGGPVNAFWFNNNMYYGNGFSGGNVTALDVCAHEFGHGIDQFTGNLAYERESGAMDEGFADIWGACVEARATPNKQRWLIGEDLNIGAIRSMANPNLFGQPDTYLGNFWVTTNGCSPSPANDFCGVHTNSGVLNYWFFLLTEGGTGTNDIGNVFNVTGVGIGISQRIAYLTKLAMNNSLADYALCRQISIQVTRNEYGIGSCEEIAVTRAWFAVGVGANYSGTIPNPVISGNNALCANGNGSYTINGSSNCLPNVTATWSITNADGSPTTATRFPTTGNTTTVSIPSTLTSGNLTLTATLSNGAIITRNIHIGSPYFGATYSNGRVNNLPIAIYFPNNPPYNFNDVCIGSSFPNVYAEAQPVGAGGVYWEVPNGYQNSSFNFIQQDGNRAYFSWYHGGATPPGYLQASISNSCGSSSTIFAFKQVNCGTQSDPCAFTKNQKYFTVSPNPSSNFIKIGVGNKPPPYECPLMKTMTTSKGIIFSKVNIYNMQGSLLKTMQQKDAKSATLGLDNLIAGSYRVEIISGDYKESHQIIVHK